MWRLLACAIGTEVTATLALKAALDQPAWYAVVAVGYVTSFALLGRILRLGAPVGVAYGVWAASGVALTAVGSAVLYGEPLTPVMLVGIGLIIAGVLCVELGSQTARRARSAAERHRAGAV